MNLSASYSALPPKASKHAPLLAFEVLVKPLALNFRYHYEGDRPTNRVDKVCNDNVVSILSGLLTFD